MNTPTLPPTVSVPSEALKAFIKDAASIVASALEVNPGACGDLQDRWIKAARDLQKSMEDPGVPEGFPTGLGDCPAVSPCGRFVCTCDKGHLGDHEALAAHPTIPIATWPQ